MTTLMSLLIVVFFLYVLFLQIDTYNKLVNTNFRFRFFALRDRLAMLVCTGDIKENSWEYKYIIDALNYHVSAVEHLSIVDVIEALVQFHTSQNEDQAFRRFRKTSDNKEVKLILDDYMRTVQRMIQRNSRWQVRFIRVAAHIARIIGLSPSAQARATIVNPEPALSAIAAHRSSLQSAVCA